VHFEFDYPDDVWAVLPAPGEVQAEDAWLEQQVAIARESYPDRADEARARAEDALDRRREGIATSLYFRPPGLPTSAVLHFAFADVIVADEQFRAEDWIPEGVHPGFPPAVAEFETAHSPHGYRVAYVSEQQTPTGVELAGLAYGLRFDVGIATVFSELSDRETTGLLEWQTDPVVSSLRLVP
jgi:hypothetical protein